MRQILRRREWLPDPWHYGHENPADDAPLIVSCAELREAPQRWCARPGPLGVRFTPADDVDGFVQYLPRLALAALEFPNFSDGRGFTQASVLRRSGFDGEVRAIGAGVKQDLLYLMARCGIDTFELAPGEDPARALRALERYTVAYQPAIVDPGAPQLRFASAQARSA